MPVYSKQWYLERFRLADVLNDSQRDLLIQTTRMQEIRRGFRSKSAPARVAHALIDLAEEHGVADEKGIVIAFTLSQRDLAHLVGLTRETVNMILHDLDRRGLVETDRQVVRLLDLDKLRPSVDLTNQRVAVGARC